MTTTSAPQVEVLPRPVAEGDLRSLAALLVDAVESGAAVSFRAPLAPDEALAWWRGVAADLAPRAAILVARDAEGIAGSVTLSPAWAPNQPHRAEIVKLLVHRRARGRGLGRALMEAAERLARERGFSLLTLDAKAGTVAESLYRSLGWTHLGTITDYALDPDGAMHDCVFFYRRLEMPLADGLRLRAATGTDLEVVRGLFREYERVIGVDLCFQGFERELRELPGAYAAPRGRLLLAEREGEAIGCVALRPAAEAGRAEMKRLFVRPGTRGGGVGRALVERVLAEAAGAGYREVVLDTLPSMTDAHRLYERLGFREVAPYQEAVIAGTRFYARLLY